MKALLLAAGLGTRLRPLTDTVPKCLVTIHGKPLLAYWLELLLAGPIDEIVVNTHHLPEAVHAFVAASKWRGAVTLVHEDSLLGTGGTVLRNRALFAGRPFLVAHADNLTRFDLGAFVASHARRPPDVDITMMTFSADRPEQCGIVELDERRVVAAFHEKVAHPPGNLANAAVYIFEPAVPAFLAGLGKQAIDLSTEVLPHYTGRMQAWHNADYHRDIGTPESLAVAEREYRSVPAPA